MNYVDGFVLPVPRKNVKAYVKIAKLASKVWRDHGALHYYECVAEDTRDHGMVSFPKLAGAKKGETVIFAFIVYKSRTHRDKVNAKVMKDPRMNNFDPKTMPFDMKRMAMGGFAAIVQA
jgi:uncharacterized protein YbaA (DUF1428 family)